MWENQFNVAQEQTWTHEPNTFLNRSPVTPEPDPNLQTVLGKPYAYCPLFFFFFLAFSWEQMIHNQEKGGASLSVFVCWEQLLGAVGIRSLDMEQWGFPSAFSRIFFVFFLCSPTFISPCKPFSLSFCPFHPDKNNINKMEELKEKQKLKERKNMARREITERFSGGLTGQIKAGQTGTPAFHICWQ